MIGLELRALDTLFFRDHTPFFQDSAVQEDVGGLFPPYPPTVVGAVRATLARHMGWNGRGPWTPEMIRVLGDGPEDLGQLTITGPLLLKAGAPLFPAPRHLLGTLNGDGAWIPHTFVRPGPAIRCDLGEVRLPIIDSPPEGLKLRPGENSWLTAAGLARTLRGELPKSVEVLRERQLWRSERRIGLAIDPQTRTAAQGMLYSAEHVRPEPDVGLGVRVDGFDHKPPFTPLVPLGGERRAATVESWTGEIAVDRVLPKDGRLLVIALTPLDLTSEVCHGSEPIAALGDARVVCACLDRPIRIGGWDSRPGTKRGPLPLRSYLAAGSALFCEVKPEKLKATLDENFPEGSPITIGERTDAGFGLVALGTWKDSNDSQEDS